MAVYITADKTEHSFKDSVQKDALTQASNRTAWPCCEREHERTGIYAEQMINAQQRTRAAWQQTLSVQHPQAKDEHISSESKGYTGAAGTIKPGQRASINELREGGTV